MEKHTLADNETNNFLPLSAKKPEIAFFVKEESSLKQFREFNYDPSVNSSADRSVLGVEDNLYSIPQGYASNASTTATDYVGATSIDVPCTINETFADFKVLSLVSTPPDVFLGSTNFEMEELYNEIDTEPRLASVQPGIQFLRIPTNRFNTLDGDGQIINKNYGKYILSITPKYVDVIVNNIFNRDQANLSTLASNNAQFGSRRKIYAVDKSQMYNTVWNFEANPKQQGRFYGSVVEVYDSTKTVKKQTLFLNEDAFNLSSPNLDGELVLHPDIVGYHTPLNVVGVGDVLRIYPHETYFHPMVFEIDYSNVGSVYELVRFMMNDVVQDTTKSIYEIYDDNGVAIDGEGNLSGNVILSYQISQEGKYSIRRKQALPTNTGQVLQDNL